MQLYTNDDTALDDIVKRQGCTCPPGPRGTRGRRGNRGGVGPQGTSQFYNIKTPWNNVKHENVVADATYTFNHADKLFSIQLVNAHVNFVHAFT